MGAGAFIGIVVLVVASIPAVLAIFGRLVMGKNGYSLAKLQLLLWTAAVAVSYLVYLWKLQAYGGANFNITISSNLLTLVGISAGSYVAATGIRAYQEQKGQLIQRLAQARVKWVTLISDNSGNLDLSKVQMLVWTVVALAAYVIELIHNLPGLDYQSPELPKVSDMLVALMGVSQAAYIGRKAVPEKSAGAQSAASAQPPQPAPPPPAAGPQP